METQQIINGKLYDTTEAEFIGEFETGMFRNFTRLAEELYRDDDGQFFIAYEGGPDTSYNNSSGIQLLTDDEAKDWIRDNLNFGTFSDYFPVEEY
jgi:hypothetical protein